MPKPKKVTATQSSSSTTTQSEQSRRRKNGCCSFSKPKESKQDKKRAPVWYFIIGLIILVILLGVSFAFLGDRAPTCEAATGWCNCENVTVTAVFNQTQNTLTGLVFFVFGFVILYFIYSGYKVSSKSNRFSNSLLIPTFYWFFYLQLGFWTIVYHSTTRLWASKLDWIFSNIFVDLVLMITLSRRWQLENWIWIVLWLVLGAVTASTEWWGWAYWNALAFWIASLFVLLLNIPLPAIEEQYYKTAKLEDVHQGTGPTNWAWYIVYLVCILCGLAAWFVSQYPSWACDGGNFFQPHALYQALYASAYFALYKYLASEPHIVQKNLTQAARDGKACCRRATKRMNEMKPKKNKTETKQ